MRRLVVGLVVVLSVLAFALYVNAEEPPAERVGGPGDSQPLYDPCDGPDDPNCCDNPHYCWLLTPAPIATVPPPPTDTPVPPPPTATPTPRPTAQLDPRPPNIRKDGTWHEFTVRSNVPVRVVANDSDRTLRISSTGRGGCPASSQNASVLRTDGKTVKLMGCKVGDARVRLFSQSDDRRLRTYNFRVLAPPTPTPTPGPSPSLCTDADAASISPNPAIGWDSYSVPGSWDDSPCGFVNNQAWAAKRYTFALDTKAHVIIDLESSRDNVLQLSGDVLGPTSNDDNEESEIGSLNTNARIARPLRGGTYTLEAAVKSGRGPFTLRFTVAELIPSDYLFQEEAHQPDHTVLYEIRGVIPQFLQRIFQPAVERAALAWSGRAYVWPWALICTSTDWRCSAQNRDNRNWDGNTLPVRVVDGSGKNIDPDGDCGYATACVDPVRGHLANAEMLIEHPAWSYGRGKDGTKAHRLVIWTEDIERAEKHPDNYRYLTGTLKHEFGHTLGLRDLDRDNYSGYLMARDELYNAGIPGPDWRYLEQVYRNEHGSRPHQEETP